jgi:hypothetical protein
MANAFYNNFKQQLGLAGFDLSGDTIKVVLVDTDDYTPNLTTDTNLVNIPAGARVATGTLASQAWTAGVFDAADITFTTVTGDPSEALVIYKDTGTEATSLLIALFDTVTGLPVTPNGGDIQIVWDNGVNKIFKL